MASGSNTPNKLLVLGEDDEFDINSYNSNFRPSSGGSIFSSRPESSSSSRRTPTPTKQISLQAVRRKEDRNDIIIEDIDFKDLNYSNKSVRKSSVNNCSRITAEGGNSELSQSNPKTSDQHERTADKKLDKNGVTDSESEEDSSDEEDETPARKAPNELLLEFVSSVMNKDYEVANKLCQMILMFEPNNPEALTFRPLIQEKIQLDQIETDSEEADSAGDDDDEDDDDDDSGDSDDDESSDSDESDSDNDEEEDNNDEEEEETEQRDSGIASASD